ncbi:MAG TPA: GNAT family N-acetyltransferase [Solirubrobacteraceae bacterium]|nr:GNAT family N-acetyltransferase [Solirubrobacteraceae bacterium]
MIRRLHPQETEPLRELRLRALRHDPGAFAETFEAAQRRPPVDWAAWAADEALAVFVAIDGDRWVGMATGRLRDDLPDGAWLSALWVDPAARRAGLGAELIDAVAGWARGLGRVQLHLSVTTNNEAAAALYGRTGFAPTGRVRPLPSDPSRTEVFLSRRL